VRRFVCVLSYDILAKVTCMYVSTRACLCVWGGGYRAGFKASENMLEFTLNILVKAVPIH
jgi:hypothetical protein